MKLSELAFACYVYWRMGDFDKSYEHLVEVTQPELDFHSSDHLKALLRWLNAWGCRQFAKEYHTEAIQQLTEWYDAVGHLMFAADTSLLALTEEDFRVAEQLYAALVHKTASHRKARNGSLVSVDVGPTGASKILFAWRPQVFIPWDEFMRSAAKLDGSACSYMVYLRKTREQLLELSHECRNAGFEIVDLPKQLGRPLSSLTKLMDEYSWVTITRKCRFPEALLQRWAAWP